MRSGQIQIPFDQPPENEGAPFLYLACPLTSVDAPTRHLLDSHCTHIINTVTEAATESKDPWRVAVHAPIWWSNPASGDGRSPQDVYKLNSQKVRDCAGMIVLALDGGSTGVGEELAWAFALRLPVLYLYPQDGEVSRQIEGTPGDLTAVTFADTSELVDAVRKFLRVNRLVIGDHRRRAKSEALMFAPLRTVLAVRWRDLREPERFSAAGIARLHADRIDELLEDDRALASASLSELVALVGSLGASFRPLTPESALPELGEREREALAQVCDEYEWSGSKALYIEMDARLELARGGVRRLRLESPEDWLRFDKFRQKNARPR
jgi:hypothetical protein